MSSINSIYFSIYKIDSTMIKKNKNMKSKQSDCQNEKKTDELSHYTISLHCDAPWNNNHKNVHFSKIHPVQSIKIRKFIYFFRNSN